jgi:hypothetical protein
MTTKPRPRTLWVGDRALKREAWRYHLRACILEASLGKRVLIAHTKDGAAEVYAETLEAIRELIEKGILLPEGLTMGGTEADRLPASERSSDQQPTA